MSQNCNFMDPLPPIPTPASQRWREFRIQALPIVVFLLILIAIVFLWRNFLVPTSVIGEVETVRANVSTTENGQIAELNVDRFQVVRKGETIGSVLIQNPETTRASLAALESELNITKARMQLDATRNIQSHEQLRIDLLDQKIDLAKAKVNLLQAISNFKRGKELLEGKIISEEEFELRRTARDALQTEVDEREKLVEQLEQHMRELEPGIETKGLLQTPIEQAVNAQEEQLRLMQQPIPLKAPIDGIVQHIYRRPGEQVLAGEPILTITSPDSNRIVGYVRTPITVRPEPGMAVEIRPRSFKRIVGNGEVLKVGGQLENISLAEFQSGTSSNVYAQALPILVSLPTNLKALLLPGEIVDLDLKPEQVK